MGGVQGNGNPKPTAPSFNSGPGGTFNVTIFPDKTWVVMYKINPEDPFKVVTSLVFLEITF